MRLWRDPAQEGGGGTPSPTPLDGAELLDEALRLSGGARQQFLAGLERRDAAAANELRELLRNLPDPETQVDAGARPEGDAFLGEPAVGELIGGCRIDSVLGRGGVGTVFSATQQQPERAVALKILRTAGARVSHMRRFRTEAAVLGRLAHPAIARIYSSGVATRGTVDMPFLVMERIEGARSVVEWAGGGAGRKPSRDEIVRCAIKVCDAMAFAHGRGVLHRDIKPSNILVGADGEPHVIDFGIARIFGEGASPDDTLAGALIGTPGYMALEQFELESADLDVRVDIHAIGILLYEMIGGQRAYEIPRQMYFDAAQIMRKREPVPLERIDATVPRDLSAIVAKAMSKRREQRYATMAELAEDLRCHLAGDPVRARPDSPVRRVVRFARRYPAWSAAIVAALAGLSLSAAISRSTLGYVRDLRRYAEGQRELVEVQRRLAEEQRVRAESTLLLSAAQDGSIRDVESSLDSIRGRVDPLVAGFARRMLDQSSQPALWKASAHLETGALSGDRTKWLVSGEAPRPALIDLARGTVLEFRVPESIGWAACMSRDGTRAYVTGSTGTIYVYDESDRADGAKRLATVGEFSARMLEGMGGRRLLLAHGAASLSTVDTKTGEVWTTRVAESVRLVRGLAWDGAGRAFMSLSSGRVLEVEVRESAPPVVRDFIVPERVAGGVTTMTLSPDGSVLALGTWYGEIAFADARTGDELGGCNASHDVWDIAFSPDGTKVAVGDRGGHIHEFAVPSGNEIASYGVFKPDPAWAVGYLADGSIVANVGPEVHLIDATPAWSVRMETCPVPIPVAVAVRPAEGGRPERLRVLAPTGEVFELPLETGRWSRMPIASEQQSRVGAFDAEARRLASWSDDKLVLHDLSDGTTRTFGVSRESAGALAWSPDGSRLALVDRTGVACLEADGRIVRVDSRLGSNMIYRIEWLDDDRFVMFDFPGVATEFVVEGGTLRAVAGFATVSAPAPRRLGERWVFPMISGTIAVTSTGGVERIAELSESRTMQLLGHRDISRSVDATPDGMLLASGGFDGTVRIWDLAKGASAVTLSASDRPIQFVAWLDGKRALIALDYAGRVRLFDSVSRADRRAAGALGAK
ncbi:MAG: protein kinase [Planctomycetaceae bacterium]|nr:protein kinase [Planctomycetaceae bacterium]